MKSHPAVPAAIVIKHVHASKNRVERHLGDADKVRRGLRALQEDAATLRASLSDQPDELAILERGLMALDYVGADIVANHERSIQIEQVFQSECKLWLNRQASRVRFPAPRAQIVYEPSKAREVETPVLPPQGREVETSTPDPKVAVGFYTMGDGTRVYVNFENEPVDPPKDATGHGAVPAKLPELVRSPEDGGEEEADTLDRPGADEEAYTELQDGAARAALEAIPRPAPPTRERNGGLPPIPLRPTLEDPEPSGPGIPNEVA